MLVIETANSETLSFIVAPIIKAKYVARRKSSSHIMKKYLLVNIT